MVRWTKDAKESINEVLSMEAFAAAWPAAIANGVLKNS